LNAAVAFGNEPCNRKLTANPIGRYLAEFDFRYSPRNASDSDRMAQLMGRTAGRRLAYKATVR
jgi:hypothetical protein